MTHSERPNDIDDRDNAIGGADPGGDGYNEEAGYAVDGLEGGALDLGPAGAPNGARDDASLEDERAGDSV